MRVRIFSTLASLASVVAVVTAVTPAIGQSDYPARPVRIIVPSEPGGGTDSTARALADRMTQSTGMRFGVENRPGAGQMIGIEVVARAAADGYVLLVAASPITINPAINANVRYDVLRDFAPVSQLVTVPSVLVVGPNMPVGSFAEFLSTARAKPGQLNYASAGTGTQPHMAMELLKTMSGVDIQHIPYKGVAPALTDILGGRIDTMFVNMVSARSHVERGNLRALANSSVTRSKVMPDLQTVAEAGVPGFEAMQWFGLFAPAGTPASVITYLNTHAAAAVRSPEVQSRLVAEGADPVGNSAESFSIQIREELTKWERVAKAAKLK